MKPKSTKHASKAPAEDKLSFIFSLYYEVNVSPKLKKVKVEPKLPFSFILTYVLFAALFGKDHLIFALCDAFIFLFTVF